MYRAGGFPEYTPSEQKVFDTIISLLTHRFRQRNYAHIHTPAVESVEILKKGGDIIDKQVYGLFGLAQGPSDVKEYGLHFDLTVPFARYVLDHLNDLTFPFKRYQMQPVRRGERTKRGRYKEFWQFDVDTIWRTGSNVGYWYDAESIIVIGQALQEIFSFFSVKKTIVGHVSHIGLTKAFLRSLEISDETIGRVCKLLDDYYKLGIEVFIEKLALTGITTTQLNSIIDIVRSGNLSLLEGIEGYEQCKHVLDSCKALGVNVVYDFAIIRGHDYYTGTVVEFFIEEDISLGAVAGGGAYDRLTDFINPKHSFSGVGCSISSRIMEIILTEGTFTDPTESYMIINTGDSDMMIRLLRHTHSLGYSAELYPTTDKFGKQFEYANKKGIAYVIMCGENEQTDGIYKIKNMKTGEEVCYPLSSLS